MYKIPVLLAFMAGCAIEQPMEPLPQPEPAVPCVMADPAPTLDLSGPDVEPIPEPVEPEIVDDIRPTRIALGGPRTPEHEGATDVCATISLQILDTTAVVVETHIGEFMAGSVIEVATPGIILDAKCITERYEMIWTFVLLID